MAYRTKRKTTYRAKSRNSRSAPRRTNKRGAPRRTTRARGRGGSQTIKIVLQHQPMGFDPAAQAARDLGLSVEPSVPRRAPF